MNKTPQTQKLLQMSTEFLKKLLLHSLTAAIIVI